MELPAMSTLFRFDPPLSIPGNGGTAKIESHGCILQTDQPDYLRVCVTDGKGEVLALGLFKHDLNDLGMYRLEDGSACTGPSPDGDVVIQQAAK
jgi:hypothetical protein